MSLKRFQWLHSESAWVRTFVFKCGSLCNRTPFPGPRSLSAVQPPRTRSLVRDATPCNVMPPFKCRGDSVSHQQPARQTHRELRDASPPALPETDERLAVPQLLRCWQGAVATVARSRAGVQGSGKNLPPGAGGFLRDRHRSFSECLGRDRHGTRSPCSSPL